MDINNNYLINLKSVFRNKLVLLFSIVSLCVPILGLINVLVSEILGYEESFFNCLLAIGLIISVFPAVMWILIYNRSKDTYSTNEFISPFKRLKVFSLTVLILEIVIAVLFFIIMISIYIPAISSVYGVEANSSFANLLYSIFLSFYSVFVVLFFIIIIVCFIISLIAFFYFILSFKFLNNINKRFYNPQQINKKGKAFLGYNIFLASIFIIFALFQLPEIFNPIINTGINSDIFTSILKVLYNIILFINFGVIAVKHILEGLVAKSYFNRTKSLAQISEAYNTPDVPERDLYETLEGMETISKDIVCPKCGESVSESSMFCNGCGSKIK